MTNELTHEKNKCTVGHGDKARTRTYLSCARTHFVAWIRNALSLISFGFGIANSFQFLQQQKGIVPPLLGPKTVGQTMIVVGLVNMIMASIQHKRALKVLREACPDLPASLSATLATLISVLGILALIAAFCGINSS